MVKSYLAGDKQVQARLYNSLCKQIEMVLARMEGQGARFLDKANLVSDLVCLIMIKDDCKILRAFHGRSKLSTYLWPIIRFRIIDAIRSERRYHDRMVRQHEVDAAGPVHQDSQIELVVAEHLAAEPEPDKFIKYAKWLSEMSYDEIIKAMSVEFPNQPPVTTARIAYILHDNRKKIQKKLKNLAVKFD